MQNIWKVTCHKINPEIRYGWLPNTEGKSQEAGEGGGIRVVPKLAVFNTRPDSFLNDVL